MRYYYSYCFILFFCITNVFGQQFRSTPPADLQFDFARWPYPLYEEVAERLREFVREYPHLTNLHTIGTSQEGRDLLILEITNSDTGPGESKPAVLANGNIHHGEVTGRQLLIYFIERLLSMYGKDPRTTRLVDTRTFYIMPIVDVDAGERRLTRHPAWSGYRQSDHAGRDLDGDGYITSMRFKDLEGIWYPSPYDPRIMIRVRDLTGSRYNYVPTTYADNMYFKTQYPNIGWHVLGPEPTQFDDPLAQKDKRYSMYIEGENFDEDAVSVILRGEAGFSSLGKNRNQTLIEDVSEFREPANFNRNWSSEWRPEDPGAGPFPFSVPEIHSLATFISSHFNIYFTYDIHSGGDAKNYIVRPPMNHPYDYIPSEDNELYKRIGAVWSALSNGGLMENNYDSEELMAGNAFSETMHGFSNDWAYLHQGILSLSPEIEGAGKDYNEDGYVTWPEIMRWNDEEKAGRYFAPWKHYVHPVFGEIEIGGIRGLPQAIDERLQFECEIHYDYLMYLADLSPLLKIKDLAATKTGNDEYRITATLQNQGFLSTYITRQALKIRRDYPIMARIKLNGGELIEGRHTKKVGHILGKFSYIYRWGQGSDESTRPVDWFVRRTGSGPISVSVEAWAQKAGRDVNTIVISRDIFR